MKYDFWRCTFCMTKYSLETKIRFIELMKTNKYSIGTAADSVNASNSVAERWWKMYSIHGLEGLSMKSGNYDGKFKIHVIKYMHENHLSVNEASAIFGIPSDATLLKWERIYYEQGEEGLLLERRGRPKEVNMKSNSKNAKPKKLDKNMEADLINEIQRLRAEVAYLKKSIALKEAKENLLIKKKQW